MNFKASNFYLNDSLSGDRVKLNTGSTLKLFQNDFTPIDHELVNGDFTEATYSGYAAKTLNPNWSAPVKDLDGVYVMDTPAQTFTHNGGGTSNTIYGAYIVDGSNNVYGMVRFSTPKLMDDATDTFDLTPKLRAKAEF